MNHVSNQQLKPAQNVADAWNMLALTPLPVNDPRYFDCSEARGVNVAQKLFAELKLHSKAKRNMHIMLTGYRGDGKTTELFRFINMIKDNYRPLYINAEDEFDLFDFRFPDFLLGIATVIFKRMEEQNLSLPEKLLENIANWFASVVETDKTSVRADLKAEAGVGIPNWFKFITTKLISSIKAGGEKRKEIRKELNQSIAHLITHVNSLLSAAGKLSKDTDNRELVAVFDNLDRLSPELAYDLFGTNGENIKDLNCNFIFVVPISLLYRLESPHLPIESCITMQIIPVHDRDNKPVEDNIKALKQLLELRFVPGSILTNHDKIMRDFILTSGGHLRDLVRLFHQTCSDAFNEPDGKINEKIAKRTINELCETYQKAVIDSDYEYLVQTYKTKDLGNNERTQRLIHYTVILVYDDNGAKWYDVHPALVQGSKFKKLL